jgi:hypothetical protein
LHFWRWDMFRLARDLPISAAISKSLVLTAAAILTVVGLFINCDLPMGLGDPVDTTPPIITITSPVLNKSFGVMVLGDPIELAGTWQHNMGVRELKVEITNVREQKIYTDVLQNYSINKDGTWEASVVIPELGEGGEAEYKIKVLAWSRAPEPGADETVIRVDVMAPWVKTVWLARHPGTRIVQETLYEKHSYDQLIDFDDEFSYRNITEQDRDSFQNNSFTVKLEVNSNLAGVAATRLHVYDDMGRKLNHEEFGKVPSRKPADPKFPEWDISVTDLLAWGGSYYATGPHYIYFEVWAWNSIEWGDNNPWDGQPPPPAPGQEEFSIRKQRIKGTCWYPEADRPHINVNDKTASTGFVVVNADSSLSLSVFDDDKLKEVYAGLIPLDTYASWRGTDVDTAYLESLRIDEAKRQIVIDYLGNNNLFNSLPGTEDRDNQVALQVGVAGEYCLVALALDDKSVYGPVPPSEAWGVNVPLRVQVLDPTKPIIIVESPAENTFPALANDAKFTITGYTISVTETKMVQIAWVSDGINPGNVELYLTQTAAYAFNENGPAYEYEMGGIHIWKLPVGPGIGYVLNDETYKRNDFRKAFDIIEDFKVSGLTENKFKLFYIYSINDSGGYSIKSYRLSNYTEKPLIELVYPTRDLMVHNNLNDLTLSMRLSPKSVDIDPASIRIIDITGPSSDPEVNAAANDAYFEEPGPVLVDGEYRRTVKSVPALASTYFREGSRRTYRFEASDILGNSIEVERKIIMSNLPALMYIRSTNASGIYGQGTILRFEAVFSMPVNVSSGPSGWPQLKLFFADPDTSPPTEASVDAYAEYVQSPAAANTVIFTYTVPADIEVPKLYTSLHPIDLNSAKIETTEAGGGEAKIDFFDDADSLQNKVEIGLDSKRPRITGAEFGQITAPNGLAWPTGSSYFNKGKMISLELKTDKQVRISGTPRAYLKVSATGPNAEAVFSSIIHDTASTIRFTYTVADTLNVPETQVAWAANTSGFWIATSTGAAMTTTTEDTITDMYGNLIDLSNVGSLLPGNLNGTTANKRAYIITIPPPAPTFTLRNIGGVLSDPVKVNGDITITINRNGGAASNKVSYSVEGGNNPRPLSGTTDTIKEKAAAGDNLASAYLPSLYQVSAWQEDLAGNRSGNAATRTVEINSRAPELDEITCAEPNGSYRTGDTLTFRLAFSRPVSAKAGETAALALMGTRDFTDTIAITQPATAGVSNSIFTFNYVVESGKQMMDIKAQSIVLSGLVDEYGNTLKNYNGAGLEDASRRPISNGSSFNLKRDSTWSGPTLLNAGLKIDSKGPRINIYNPIAPGAGKDANGGLMEPAMNKTITLTFDKEVWANSGKTITIRPYGKWAVPPILTGGEMEALYNSLLFDPVKRTEYQRRLYWTDPYGLPELENRTVAGADAAYQERHKYNFYIRNAHGITSIGNKIRPDTSAKWVLAFQHDLYDGVTYSGWNTLDNLREVFNAAHWKWQIISTTSGSVRVDSADRRKVYIEIPEPLDEGRIWEVLMEDGAFRDQAQNGSAEIKPNEYRFWSSGTAKPVIRVDRYSHGDNYHGVQDADPYKNSFTRGDMKTRPAIDTKVRIDCETPGADIRYDVIRTSYTMAAAAGSTQANGGIWGSAAATATGFFNHKNASEAENSPPTGGTPASNVYYYNNPGYGNNMIGNGGNPHGTVPPDIKLPPTDVDGFFTGLLVPNKNDTTNGFIAPGTNNAGDVPAAGTANGAIPWADITARGAGLESGGNLNGGAGYAYRTVAAGGAETLGPNVFDITVTSPLYPQGIKGHFFYVGSARNTTSDAAANDYDPSLYSARRDYIVAAAQKKEVTVNTDGWAGPVLNASRPGANGGPEYEGVFKTTLLYREPANGMSWFLIEGFDTPTIPSQPGFPLQEFRIMPPVNDILYTYFARQAYRIGAYIPVNQAQERYPWASSGNGFAYNNNYIWVSWEILVDFYQKGRNQCYYDRDGNNIETIGRQQRANLNYGAVLCTYGAINYRYRQFFDYPNGTGVTR